MKPGIYPDILNEDYHAGPGISASGLKLIAERSPLHYWSAYLDPQREQRKTTPAMILGTAIHAAVLEPATFAERFHPAPDVDRRTKEGKMLYEVALGISTEQNATLISSDDYAAALKVQRSCRDHPLAQAIFAEGKAEQSVFWIDPETEVLCKCRPDWLMPGAIVDVKSTEDASAEAFMRSAYNWQYHIQAAFYMDGIAAAWGEMPEAFMFLAHEKTAPWASAYYFADGEMIESGRAEYRKALRLYADCLNKDKWPGYAATLQPLGLPRWAKKGESDAA